MDKEKGSKSSSEQDKSKSHSEARRDFLKQTSLLTALALTPASLLEAAEQKLDQQLADAFEQVKVTLQLNGKKVTATLDPRVTLLDFLREHQNLTGTKKGCDYGQCGACTVHINGERILACLTLTVMQQGKKITTIEGLAQGDQLHPLQAAFIHHDGFQCGYCTPGQIMSGIACIREGHANSEAEIREYMSGNICRCGAYPNIVKAIAEVKNRGQKI